MPRARARLLLLPALLVPASAAAQDAFEIQVYEYATVPRGMWNLETHFNYVADGTTAMEGPVAPTEHQRHLTFELTRGITDWFEFAGYLVLAGRTDHAAEFAGWRLRPRVRFPETRPVALSLSAEVGFPRDAYEENSTTLEIRPVVEKRFGRVQADLNPVIGRALRGPGKAEGRAAEPGARLAVAASDRVDVSVEYYGAWGPVSDLFPAARRCAARGLQSCACPSSAAAAFRTIAAVRSSSVRSCTAWCGPKRSPNPSPR